MIEGKEKVSRKYEKSYFLLDHLPFATLILNRKGDILFSNKRFRILFGDKFKGVQSLKLLSEEVFNEILTLMKKGKRWNEFNLMLSEEDNGASLSFKGFLTPIDRSKFLFTLQDRYEVNESLERFSSTEDELRRKNWELTLLNDIIYLMNQSFSVERMLSLSLNLLITRMDFDMGTIRLIEVEDNRRDQDSPFYPKFTSIVPTMFERGASTPLMGKPGLYLSVVVSKGISEKKVAENKKIRLDPSSLEGFSTLTGETRYSTDGEKDFKLIENCKSGIVIPLRARGKVHGVMFLGKKEKRLFSPGEVAFFTQLGTHMGMVVDNATLFRNLDSTYKELLSTQEKLILREKLAAIGELSAKIAHEIRNPLTAISNALSMIEKEIQATEMKGNRFITLVFEEIERLENILKDFLYFSRFIPLKKSVVAPIDLIKGVIFVLIQDKRWSGDIELIQDYTIDTTPIYIDAERFREVVWNLLSNSLDSLSESKGGKIWIRLKGIRDREKDLLELRIQDNGPGIKQEYQDRIFEPFFTTRSRGTGLGLSIVKRAVDELEGEISFTSTPGDITEFIVRLPLVKIKEEQNR